MKFLKIILLSFVLFSSNTLLAKNIEPLSVKEKKEKFFNTLVVAVNSVYMEFLWRL